MSVLRLDKLLSEITCESRANAKKYIKSGRVTVDGIVCLKGEERVDTDKSVICLDSRPLCYKKYVYYMLNKPAGVVSATEDKNDKTVTELIKKEASAKRLFPVGRLDKDTVGLIILTNNGAFAHNTLSPKKHIDKTYYVEADGRITQEDIKKFAEGIEITGKDGDKVRLKSAYLRVLSSEDSLSRAEITISEGKFHQIKKMFIAVGKRVTYLKRIKFGDITLDECLKEGEYRELNNDEMKYVEKFI